MVSVEFNCSGDHGNDINEEVLRAIWLAERKDGSHLPLVRVKLIDQEEYYKDQPDTRSSGIHDSEPLPYALIIDDRVRCARA